MEFQWKGRLINNKVRFVKANDKYNLADRKDNILSKDWFDSIYQLGCSDEFFVVWNENKLTAIDKCNILDVEGNLLSPDLWFDDVNHYVDFNENQGFGVVELNGKHNFIDKKGNLISKTWFDRFTRFNNNKENPFAIIRENNIDYILYTDGTKEKTQRPYHFFL